nr:histone deacetylase 5-like isoform X1 [Tanacetum cinerariifolium]
MFWKDSRALVFSVHRHENGSFYPGGDDGSHVMVGEGPAMEVSLSYALLVRENLSAFWPILAKMLHRNLTSRVTPLPEIDNHVDVYRKRIQKLKAKAVEVGVLIEKQNIAIEECEKHL